MDTGHVAITLDGIRHPLVVDLATYSEVDVIDFAPRAVSGSPAFSELGLYLQVAQAKFGHGFGRDIFEEEASYAYTGTGIDTRHGTITLFTAPVSVKSEAGWYARQIITHSGVVLIAEFQDLCVISAGSLVTVSTGLNPKCLLSNGKYFFVGIEGTSNRMRVGDVGTATSATSTTLVDTSKSWTTDLFNGGTVFIYAGTGSGQSQAITDTAATTITVASWSTQPDSTSKYMVLANAGVGSNPPYDVTAMTMFGGYMWMAEKAEPWIHFWAELDGTDAEGGQDDDTAAVRIGPGNIGIVNMSQFQNQLWVCREDGAWVVGDDNLAYHTLDFTDQIDSNNFRALYVWNGFLWFNIRNRLYKYRSGLLDSSPPRWDDHWPYKEFGAIWGAVPRGSMLYILARANQANSTDESQEVAGFLSLLATSGVGWHKLLDFPGTNPSQYGIWLSPTEDKLYVTYLPTGQDEQGKLYTIQLQSLSDLPYESFPTTGSQNWYSSYYDLTYRRVPKSFASLALDGQYPAGASVKAYYRLDEVDTWTYIGTFDEPMQEIYFPDGTEGKKIQIKLTLVATNVLYSPIVTALILKLMIRPDVLYGVNCEFIVADHSITPGGHRSPYDATQIRDVLKGARSSVSPITFEDIFGYAADAYVSSLRFIVVEGDDGHIYTIGKATLVYV